MDKLLFNKKQEKYCKHCIHGKTLEYTGEVFCKKRGFVSPLTKCRKYKYDPIKRTPQVAKLNTAYKKDDFVL